MALDHYIARTYLKHWCDKAAGRPLRAYRKSDSKEFPCWPAEVCAEPDGDTNAYLTKPDMLGQYRKLWEPRWNAAVDGFRHGEFTGDNKFVLALGWASIALTTPTTTGIGTDLLQHQLKMLAGMIAPPPPPGVSLDDLKIEVDPKFAQANFTLALPSLAWRLYVQKWSLLNNSTPDAFLTSDNPSAVFGQDNLGSPPAHMLPLAPDLCVTTVVDRDLVIPVKADLTQLVKEPCGAMHVENAIEKQVGFVNSLIVKHAGDIVFSSREDAAVGELVKALRELGVTLDHTPMPLQAVKGIIALAEKGIGKVR